MWQGSKRARVRAGEQLGTTLLVILHTTDEQSYIRGTSSALQMQLTPDSSQSDNSRPGVEGAVQSLQWVGAAEGVVLGASRGVVNTSPK